VRGSGNGAYGGCGFRHGGWGVRGLRKGHASEGLGQGLVDGGLWKGLVGEFAGMIPAGRSNHPGSGGTRRPRL
jgi:hypothetical protein